MIDHANGNQQIVSLHERSGQLTLAESEAARASAEGEAAKLRIEVAKLKDELANFTIAVETELARRPTIHDDDITREERPGQLDDKPRLLRRGCVLAPGSINACREGDLSFAGAQDVPASAKFRDGSGRAESASSDDWRGQVPDAARDTVDLRGVLAAAVTALGAVMLEMKRREFLSMLPTREREQRLRESSMIDAEVGELASRAFEEGTLALVRSGHPDAVMSPGKISLEEAVRLPENRDTCGASEES